MKEHSKKFNDLYAKAKAQNFLTIDDLNLNYADSDEERIELCDLLREEGIEITFSYDIDSSKQIKQDKPKTKTVKKAVKRIITSEEELKELTKPKKETEPKKDYLPDAPDEDTIIKTEDDNKEKKPTSLKDLKNKKKKVVIEEDDELDNEDDLSDDYDDEDLSDELDSIDDDEDSIDDEDNDDEYEDLAEDDLDTLNDEDFYNASDDNEAEKYEYDNFDDLIYSEASKSNTKIVVSDPVRMYLKEIGRINLLTPDEEKEIAKVIYDTQREKEEYDEKIKRGIMPTSEEEAYMKKRIEQGEQAKKTLIEANLRLVVNIAKHFNNADMEFADLIQEGSIGLSKAVTKFDYTRGNKFSTYATGWIKQAITRAIADQARTIRIPVHMNETINKLNKKERELTHDLGRKPTYEELADVMGVTVDKLMMIKRVSQKTKSLEDPVGEEDDSSYGDFIPDNNSPNPEEYTANEALKREINTLLSNLSDREERVIKLRFGLIDGRIKTLEEVGKEYNVTRERIRQIEAKALRKLKHPSRRNKLLDFNK